MKKILLMALFAGLAVQGYAQNFLDLIRYSQTHPWGTARSMGMGGAIGAVGTDYSVSSINPASLAQIRTNQAMGTLGLNFNGNTADYLGTGITDSKFNFSLPNMGMVIATVRTSRGKERKTGLINYSFAFGYNRINEFNRDITLDANNPNSSYLDYLAEQATKYQIWDVATSGNFYPFYPEELALAANTIVHTGNNQFQANLPSTINMRQNYRYQQSGRQQDWNISWAGNFDHRFYLGMGIGIPGMRYHSTERIIEQSKDPQFPRSFEHVIDNSTSGIGFNAKFGLTVRASDWLRLGAAYHTPTTYALTDQYTYTFMSRGFDSGQFVYNSGELLASDQGNSEYSFTTPGKSVFSAALIIKKLAIIGFDYEYVDYTKAQTSTEGFSDINTLVRKNLRPASNVRIGAEFNYLDYRFRAGYGVYASPFNNRILESLTEGNLALQTYSLGAGYQSAESNVFFDAGLVYERYDDFYTPYTLETTNRAYASSFNKVRNTRFVFTVGTRF